MSLIQTIDWLAIAPPLVCAIGALAVLLVDLLLPRPTDARRRAGLRCPGRRRCAARWLWSDERATFCVPAAGAFDPSCSYVVDDVTLVLQLVVLAGAAVVVLMSMSAVREEAVPAGEYCFLLLSSVTGAVTLAACARPGHDPGRTGDAVAAGVRSGRAAPRWVATGRAAEAALKFFLSSVMATAVSLFGISLIYGVTGQVFFDRLVVELPRVPADQAAVAAVGIVLTLVAFAFKVAAVPFHAWAPDTYQGAAVPVAAYLSVVSKAGGFAGLVLVLTRGVRTVRGCAGPRCSPCSRRRP